jgi:hypothetical protein
MYSKSMVNIIPPTTTPVAAVKVQQSEAGVVEPQHEDHATHGVKCIYKPLLKQNIKNVYN